MILVDRTVKKAHFNFLYVGTASFYKFPVKNFLEFEEKVSFFLLFLANRIALKQKEFIF